MPMVALAAYSAYQGVQASKAARQDAASRDAATARQEALGAEDRKYYRDKYGPMNQMLVDYAMGNKPSPYLAKAKGQIEEGYQKGMTQLNEISGNQNLGQSGIGQGQQIGLGMDAAKAKAGLDLQDQAQRYGVAQSLSNQESLALQGSNTMAHADSQAAGYHNQDAQLALKAASSAGASAATGFGNAINDAMSAYGSSGDNNETTTASANMTSEIEHPMEPIAESNRGEMPEIAQDPYYGRSRGRRS